MGSRAFWDCDSVVNVLLMAQGHRTQVHQRSLRRFGGEQEFYPAHNPSIPPLQRPRTPHPGSLLPQTQMSRLPVERIPSTFHPPETPKTDPQQNFYFFIHSSKKKSHRQSTPLILWASWFLTSMDTHLSLSREGGNSAKLMRLLDLLCFCQWQH